MTPLIERRINNPEDLGTKLFRKMAEGLNKDAAFLQELKALPDQSKRSDMCQEEILGHENYKQNKNRLNNKIKTSS